MRSRKVKEILCLLLVIALTFALVGCGTGSDVESEEGAAAPAEDAVEPVVIKFNYSKPATDAEYTWLAEMFAQIEEESGGTVKFEMYPSEGLGKAVDMIAAAASGESIIQDCDVSYLTDYLPEIGVFMAPYLVREPEDFITLVESDIYKEMMQGLEEQGLKIGFFSYLGPRNLIIDRPVSSREDLNGVKIRCASTPLWNEIVRVLGGQATAVALSETYQALSQGVASGAENALSVLHSYKFYEVCKYLIRTEHLQGHTAYVMSAEVFNSLPQQAQDAWNKAAAEYLPYTIEKYTAYQAELQALMEAEGVTFMDIDKTAFIEAAAETPALFPEWGEGTYEAVLEALGY
jgi:TRAP-type C4-dicarboxylate transport system substrate-binding protein